MLHRRISYAALLGAAVLFQIFFRFYLSTFTLVLVALLPVLSLLLSLPAALRCALTLSPAAPAVALGERAVFQLRLTNRSGLPLPWLKVRLLWHNQLTGAEGGAVLDRPVTGQGALLAVEPPTPHCGHLVCRAVRPAVCDLLGLFSLPLRAPGEAAALVLPVPLEMDAPQEPPPGQNEGTTLRPRPGGGPGEDYDLREYRAGDPLRSVHWKLSSKLDELVVRETLEPQRAPLVLTFDHFGPPEALDQTFARLMALSRLLLDWGRPHHIQWAAPVSGAVEDRAVDSERALLACLEAAFSLPAPESGRSILDAALRVSGGSGPVRHLHVTPQGVEGGSA